MFIRGCKEYDKDGNEIETGFISGRITSDGELKETKSGKPWARASIKVANRKDGSAWFVTLKSFSGRYVDSIRMLEKGDQVAVTGSIHTSEYNGKKYYDMVVDWMDAVSSVSGNAPVMPGEGVPVYPDAEKNFNNLMDRANGFAEIEDDNGELPF